MDFKDNIRKLLEEEFQKRIKLNNGKYTEFQFSKDMGINKDTMHCYLTGTRVPNAESLLKISNALDVSVDYLLGLSKTKYVEPTKADEELIRLTNELSKVNEENKRIKETLKKSIYEIQPLLDIESYSLNKYIRSAD